MHGGTQNAAPNDWSRDGRYNIYTVPGRTGFDLFQLSLTSNAPPQALAKSAFNEMDDAISPNGQLLAFLQTSRADSRMKQIYVQSFPGRMRQVHDIHARRHTAEVGTDETNYSTGVGSRLSHLKDQLRGPLDSGNNLGLT